MVSILLLFFPLFLREHAHNACATTCTIYISFFWAHTLICACTHHIGLCLFPFLYLGIYPSLLVLLLSLFLYCVCMGKDLLSGVIFGVGETGGGFGCFFF